jgi:hypothetical protein
MQRQIASSLQDRVVARALAGKFILVFEGDTAESYLVEFLCARSLESEFTNWAGSLYAETGVLTVTITEFSIISVNFTQSLSFTSPCCQLSSVIFLAFERILNVAVTTVLQFSYSLSQGV